ncbi:group 2 truncated hemoglobin GlbO [Sideroxyarcus emersonii]|uniref:Group 2 truncated hemoglobin GlbO n=1 Tax=Sideroxyarcus emersonii TaxID=2764705 RepID=A0AAN1XAG0_9PROT|nr:group II truncated hemoglobin [Sideroxyarcus emersonii]BCK87920.1 group 2 truncated hemoglobin GlbO [Sideroxyarcus emersonii]
MQISNDKRSHYERIGGEAKVRELVQRFYHLMDELPEAYGIRKMHQPSLQGAEDKLFMFLSGWMGGPPLFVEKFGHPALRMRHMPFSIGKSERDQWLLCMGQALDEVVEEEALRNELKAAFIKVADFMRNQSEPD